MIEVITAAVVQIITTQNTVAPSVFGSFIGVSGFGLTSYAIQIFVAVVHYFVQV